MATGANVLIALFAERESHAVWALQQQEMTRLDAVTYISHGVAKNPAFNAETAPPQGVEGGAEEAAQKQDALAAYAVDLNVKAREGRIDPLIGRQAEVDRTIQVLCRRTKNNPLFVGDSGVGKTVLTRFVAWMNGQTVKHN